MCDHNATSAAQDALRRRLRRGNFMDIDMDIKELEAFVYVVENCSFSRAAELLHLTQPTISSHVSALERKLNIKLIVRTTKET